MLKDKPNADTEFSRILEEKLDEEHIHRKRKMLLKTGTKDGRDFLRREINSIIVDTVVATVKEYNDKVQVDVDYSEELENDVVTAYLNFNEIKAPTFEDVQYVQKNLDTIRIEVKLVAPNCYEVIPYFI